MEKRELTGKYYLKRTWFGAYNVMVETVNKNFCEDDLTYGPDIVSWETATPLDIITLKINKI